MQCTPSVLGKTAAEPLGQPVSFQTLYISPGPTDNKDTNKIQYFDAVCIILRKS